MKGKLDVRFDMPNLGKLRTRLIEPEPTLTKELRVAAAEAVCQVINENSLSFKTKMIEKVLSMENIVFKDDKAMQSVTDLLGGIFYMVTAPTAEELERITTFTPRSVAEESEGMESEEESEEEIGEFESDEEPIQAEEASEFDDFE